MGRVRTVAAALGAAILLVAAPATAAPAAAGADTTPPSAPVLLGVDGYECLEIAVLFDRSTDDVTPQGALRYGIYSDGAFIGWSVDRGGRHIRAAAYVLEPGTTTITIRAFDAAGNSSADSNGASATTTKPPC